MVLVPLLATAALACGRGQELPEGTYQGVVELTDTVVAFDVAGRVETRPVTEGDEVAAGDMLATLDDSLAVAERNARALEASASASEATVIRLGSRPEELRAMQARIRAAKATEAFLEKNLERQQALLSRSAASSLSVDDLNAQLARAIADRQSLEQQLSEMRKGARDEQIEAADERAKAAAASVELSDILVGHHTLKAPIAGTVLDVHVEVGEVVGVGGPVVTMADTQHPFVDVFVPEGAVHGFKLGDAARVRVDALDHAITGKIEHIARETEFTPKFLFSPRERPNLVIRVRVRLDDAKRELHAGLPAFVNLGGTK
ncbi:MAG: HlyD family efflux transporter periplasmic adaptor subunit [Polyangiales bacterium]